MKNKAVLFFPSFANIQKSPEKVNISTAKFCYFSARTKSHKNRPKIAYLLPGGTTYHFRRESRSTTSFGGITGKSWMSHNPRVGAEVAKPQPRNSFSVVHVRLPLRYASSGSFLWLRIWMPVGGTFRWYDWNYPGIKRSGFDEA